MSSLLPFEMPSGAGVPSILNGYVSVRSVGGKSCFSLKKLPRGVRGYHGKSQDHRQAVKALESIGFTVLANSRLGIAVAGAPGAFEELTGGQVVTRERLLHAEGAKQRYVTHVDIVGEGQPEVCGYGNVRSASARLEGVLIERPRLLQGVTPSPIPPPVDRDYLRVPDDIAVALGAPSAHRAGHRGSGVTIAMVDSGQYPHPFFFAHGYDVQPTVAVVPNTSPTEDPVGHGTGESANIFAVAPEAQLKPYRASNDAGRLTAAIAAFLQAKAQGPAILTNSWGGDGPFPPPGPPDQFDIAWALEILDAIDQGIFVVFSAGNGSFTIEPQVPGVMAAGGVYMENDLDLSASNYASGYASPWIQDRVVPDVCGLVGLLPRAAYIMLPVPPGSQLDVGPSRAQGTEPGDGTTESDGWGLFSGTSAAAPQLAGVAALILSARPNLNPLQVAEAMTETAIDVTTGRCNPRFNNPAEIGGDLATGSGLVNASAAVEYAINRFQ